MLIGILGIQGSREEHEDRLNSLGAKCLYVRTPEELKQVDAIIMPGGESTTIGKLMRRNKLGIALKKCIIAGMPVYGTCAGAILLAKKIVSEETAPGLEVMDLEISRNAYGRQLDSFIQDLDIPVLGKKPLEAVFIRAPKIEKVGKNVKVLAKCQGSPVFVREKNMLISTFHPELTDDNRVHEYFLNIINGTK